MYTPPCSSPTAPQAWRLRKRADLGSSARGMAASRSHRRCRSISTYADDGTPQALFHVARHNPLVKLADGTSSWLLAVTGADAYVSPDWYVSPDQVPTWLYQAVHLTGTVRPLSDDELGAADRHAQRQIREPAAAEEAVDVGEDDGRAAGGDEEGDRGTGDDG